MKTREQKDKFNEYQRAWRKKNIKRPCIVKEHLDELPNDAIAIPLYPTYYITPSARVYRISEPRTTGFTTIPSRIIEISQLKNVHVPYIQVQLYLAGKRKLIYLHKLMALAFIGLPQGDRTEVNHINGITTDNSISNLEWVSRKENSERRVNARQKFGHLKTSCLEDYDAGMKIADIVRKYEMKASHHIYGWLTTRKNNLEGT